MENPVRRLIIVSLLVAALVGVVAIIGIHSGNQERAESDPPRGPDFTHPLVGGQSEGRTTTQDNVSDRTRVVAREGFEIKSFIGSGTPITGHRFRIEDAGGSLIEARESDRFGIISIPPVTARA
jgi:hypothetical protein